MQFNRGENTNIKLSDIDEKEARADEEADGNDDETHDLKLQGTMAEEENYKHQLC